MQQLSIRQFNWRPIGFALGWLWIILGICLLPSIFLSYLYTETTIQGFLTAAFIIFFLGGSLVLAFWEGEATQLKLKEGFLFTILSWCTISLLASLPFYFSNMSPFLTDAIFESVSSLTTTGITIFSNEHYMNEGLRLWKIFLQWIGGLGIILMAMTLLPALKIGSSQLMFAEFSDKSEKIMPRASQIATALLGLYSGLTLLCTLLLWAGNLSFRDALFYGMGTISTGGSMIVDQPLSSLNTYCKIILICGMAIGGSTLILFIRMLQKDWKAFFKDEQIRGYYQMLSIGALLSVWWLWNKDTSPICNGIFCAISAMTTTGFFYHTPYDGFLSIIFLILSFIGGCAGSTSGGIKVFRIQILYRLTKNQLLKLVKPFGVFTTLYNHMTLSEASIFGIIASISLYIVGWFILSLLFTFFGHTFSDGIALGGSIITNSGLYLSPFVGNLNELCTEAKWVAIFGMLAGRFEFITLFVVLLMPFWRR